MASYQFSHFSSSEFDQLHLCLSSLFDISKTQLASLYQTLQQEFDLEKGSELCLPRQRFQSTDTQFQQKYEKALLVGADLPSLLEIQGNDVSNSKTIIILGQDPLRRGTQRIDDMTIATPYGLHLKDCRERHRNTRLYFELIKVLLNEGYRVYLTDIYKIWCSQENCDRHLSLCRADQQRFIRLLQKEIAIMNATAVITWGGVASHIAKQKLQIQPIEFPHPSGAANGYWSKLLGKAATHENKINYWTKEVTEALAA